MSEITIVDFLQFFLVFLAMFALKIHVDNLNAKIGVQWKYLNFILNHLAEFFLLSYEISPDKIPAIDSM